MIVRMDGTWCEGDEWSMNMWSKYSSVTHIYESDVN